MVLAAVLFEEAVVLGAESDTSLCGSDPFPLCVVTKSVRTLWLIRAIEVLSPQEHWSLFLIRGPDRRYLVAHFSFKSICGDSAEWGTAS